MAKHNIYTMSFAKVYQLYINKAERKGRTKAEVDEIILWLTGYSQMNPLRSLIIGVVCGVRVEDIEEPLMRETRYLDKLIDELAKGKSMDKILRKE